MIEIEIPITWVSKPTISSIRSGRLTYKLKPEYQDRCKSNIIVRLNSNNALSKFWISFQNEYEAINFKIKYGDELP